MKYLLLVHFVNGCESYYADDPDKLKEYAEIKKISNFEIYELKKPIYSYIEAN